MVKKSWNNGETKYTDFRILNYGLKISKTKKEQWKLLSIEEQTKIIGHLTLAANCAKKDTKIEIIINNILKSLNINFIKNYRYNKYVFDFYLIDYDFVIECQGDYWHGNNMLFPILNNIQLNNKKRDVRKLTYLNENNIKSLFLWENEIYRFKNILPTIILNSIKFDL